MNNTEVWQAVLAELELSISKANFITWFKNTGIVAINDGQVVICVPNTFAKAWLEKKYHLMIIKSLERITERPVKRLEYKIDNIKNVVEHEIDFSVPAKANLENKQELISENFGNKIKNQGNTNSSFTLNPKYVFESYVVGKGSELAYAAAQAVVSKPGESYNPLFIYGGVGLGKTHLLQAIGNSILKNNPEANIVYVSAEKFSNDFIQSVQEGKAKEFQNRYRNVDLLLIDDIQFIAGKDRTQESFFHTFNELHQQNKQVVLTSDRPPKAIPMLEDRLKSRFEWGMIADISSPDFETRVAILKKKCEEKSFELSEKSLFLIASTVQSNIRELEGALNKIIVYHQLKNMAPTPESIKNILSSVEASQGQKMITPKQITEVVGGFYNVVLNDLLGKSREKKLSFPRQIIMYMLREDLKMSYPSIGEELGGRDHTTAMHAHEKIKTEIEKDMKLRQEIELIKQKIYNS